MPAASASPYTSPLPFDAFTLAAVAADRVAWVLVLVAAVPLGAGYGLGLVSGLLETQRIAAPDELAGLTAYEMAATVDFGLDAKQGLLELRSETARLELVTRLFRAATKRLDFVDRAQARARSNGKVRFG